MGAGLQEVAPPTASSRAVTAVEGATAAAALTAALRGSIAAAVAVSPLPTRSVTSNGSNEPRPRARNLNTAGRRWHSHA